MIESLWITISKAYKIIQVYVGKLGYASWLIGDYEIARNNIFKPTWTNLTWRETGIFGAQVPSWSELTLLWSCWRLQLVTVTSDAEAFHPRGKMWERWPNLGMSRTLEGWNQQVWVSITVSWDPYPIYTKKIIHIILLWITCNIMQF